MHSTAIGQNKQGKIGPLRLLVEASLELRNPRPGEGFFCHQDCTGLSTDLVRKLVEAREYFRPNASSFQRFCDEVFLRAFRHQNKNRPARFLSQPRAACFGDGFGKNSGP